MAPQRSALGVAYVLIIACVFVAFSEAASCSVPRKEVNALKDFYHDTGGSETWRKRDNWLRGDPCEWHGITCGGCSGGAKHVHVIDLEWNELDGNLTDSIGDLTELMVLNLGTNNMVGSLPDGLGNCKKLRALRLSYNRFEGKWPRPLLQARHMEVVEAPYNDFAGNVNNLLEAYPYLRKISFRGNRGISGDLQRASKALKKMKQLRYMDLHGNHIGGLLPSTLFKLPELEEVTLSKNEISGSLPKNIRSKKLKKLTLTNNFLNGTLPKSLGRLPDLVVLDFEKNYISGTIPSTFSQLKSIVELKLDNNLLEGSIPSGVFDLSTLKILDLSNNEGLGDGKRPLPADIGKLTGLNVFRCHSCRLIGTIPASITALKDLRILALYNNRLSGTVPENIGDLDKLELLSLRTNHLEGAVPDSIGNLRKLKRLDLNDNEFTYLSERVGDCESLTHLMLYNNKFAQPMPSVLGYLDKLQVLALHGNQFTGDHIPGSYGNLMNLVEMTAHDNNIPGNPRPHIDSSHSNPYNRYSSCDDLSNHTTGGIATQYFRICGTRNDFMVDVLLQEGQKPGRWTWRETHGGNWNAVYGKCKKNAFFDHHYDFQRAAQFQDMTEVAQKDKFAAHMLAARERFGDDFDFHPPTFRMPFEIDDWQAEHDRHPEGYWLLKPTISCCGQNIRLINGPRDPSMPQDLGNWIIQRFVHPPHIIQGHKYVLRLFAMVTGFSPLKVWLLPEGDVFYTHANYTLDPKKTEKSRGYFITDYFFTKKQRDMFTSSTHLYDHFHQSGIDTDKIWQDVQDVVVKALMVSEVAMRHQLNTYDEHRSTIFEVLGYDIVLDENLKPYVCEVNTAPNLGLEINKANDPVIHEEDFELKTILLRDTLVLTGSIPLDENHMNYERSKQEVCEQVVEDTLAKHHLSVNESAYCEGLTDFHCITREEVHMLKEFECEYARRNHFQPMFPAQNANKYLHLWPIPRRENHLIAWYYSVRPKDPQDLDEAKKPLPWSRSYPRVWRQKPESYWDGHTMTPNEPCLKWNTDEEGEIPDPDAEDTYILDDEAQFPDEEFPEDREWDSEKRYRAPADSDENDENEEEGSGNYGAARDLESDLDNINFDDTDEAEAFAAKYERDYKKNSK